MGGCSVPTPLLKEQKAVGERSGEFRSQDVLRRRLDINLSNERLVSEKQIYSFLKKESRVKKYWKKESAIFQLQTPVEETVLLSVA